MSRSHTLGSCGLTTLLILVWLALTLPAAAAPRVASHPSAAAHKTYIVKMAPGPNGTFTFQPAKLTIGVGDTVKWVDVNTTPHNIVGQGSAASVIKKTAVDTKSYTVTFTKPGTYKYVCQVHLPAMKGQIVVAYVVKMQPAANGTFAFNPATVTIHSGDTVMWVDTTSTPHNIVGQGNAAALIKKMSVDTKSYTVTFAKAGTYKYVCQIHLPAMKGQIIVKK